MDAWLVVAALGLAAAAVGFLLALGDVWGRTMGNLPLGPFSIFKFLPNTEQPLISFGKYGIKLNDALMMGGGSIMLIAGLRGGAQRRPLFILLGAVGIVGGVTGVAFGWD